MNLLPIRLATTLALLLAAPAAAGSSWPHDPATNVGVCTVPGIQYSPVAVSDAAGGAIIVWVDQRDLASDLYAQRLDASGRLRWQPGGVPVSTAAARQDQPVVVSDGSGGVIVAWVDTRNSVADDIFAQRVDSTGLALWTPNGVAVCTAGNNQGGPVIVTDIIQGAIVVWWDFRNSLHDDIFAQGVSWTGVNRWQPNGLPVCRAREDQIFPAGVSDDAGGAILAWEDYRNRLDADLYAQRVDFLGQPKWATDGVPLCSTSSQQFGPKLVGDGAGGAIVTWTDFRSQTDSDVFAQRVTAAGTIPWPANGVAVCGLGDLQRNPRVASDGSGGGIVVWEDHRKLTEFDLYAQRIDSTGALHWPASGVPVCVADHDQLAPSITSDGAGGAIVTWTDDRLPDPDVYAQRIDGNGTVLWTTDGVRVGTASGSQSEAVVVPDGAEGALVAWTDERNGADRDIYAQRVERFGYLGDPSPVLRGVRDIPGDQGGLVRARWAPSYLDTISDPRISEYRLYRWDPTGYDWELAGSEPAGADSLYQSQLATSGDSTASALPTLLIRVRAVHTSGTGYWDSEPLAGYSVDNLAPAGPSAFAGEYFRGIAVLHWRPSPEPDLAHYRLYRTQGAGDIPGPQDLEAILTDTSYVDLTTQAYYYKLAADDVHGNESVLSVLSPADIGWEPDQPPLLEPVLEAPRPNPTRGQVTLLFGLPSPAEATVTLHDLAGRRVRRLWSGRAEIGLHRIVMDLADPAQPAVPKGLYFLRLEVGGRSFTRRLVVMN